MVDGLGAGLGGLIVFGGGIRLLQPDRTFVLGTRSFDALSAARALLCFMYRHIRM